MEQERHLQLQRRLYLTRLHRLFSQLLFRQIQLMPAQHIQFLWRLQTKW
nr:MAG TPA: hypothetical protein [Caudoviricetes sp.]